MAETVATKQQLIVMNRGKKRAPKLTTFDRFVFGILAFFIGENRLKKVAIIIKHCLQNSSGCTEFYGAMKFIGKISWCNV